MDYIALDDPGGEGTLVGRPIRGGYDWSLRYPNGREQHLGTEVAIRREAQAARQRLNDYLLSTDPLNYGSPLSELVSGRSDWDARAYATSNLSGEWTQHVPPLVWQPGDPYDGTDAEGAEDELEPSRRPRKPSIPLGEPKRANTLWNWIQAKRRRRKAQK